MAEKFSNQTKFQNIQGERINIYPSEVKGKYKNLRQITHVLLLAIFITLPWLKWQGQQLVLFDVMGRRFHFFGLNFWSHDAPLFFFVLAGVGIGLFFITAVWGRIWCGWACPQTVFIEALFRKIEKWIEGSHLQRKKLDMSPWGPKKLFKKSLKWFLFTLIALNISHPFLAYFIGAERLLEMSLNSPYENWETFILMLSVSLLLLLNFGWFREQFCIIMCPYGRFQSVLMDENTLLVAYDKKRGEPRHKAREQGEYGACIDCGKCVSACPTGIDIRDGLQLECIACTACIDACDEVMEKVKRPKGLIRYTTGNALQKKKTQLIRPRTVTYAAILWVLFIGLIVSLSQKNSFSVNALRARQEPYSFVPNTNQKIIQNHIRFHISNPQKKDMEFKIILKSEFADRIKIISPLNRYIVDSETSKEFHVFLQFNRDMTNSVGYKKISFHIFPITEPEQNSIQELNLVGPK